MIGQAGYLLATVLARCRKYRIKPSTNTSSRYPGAIEVAIRQRRREAEIGRKDRNVAAIGCYEMRVSDGAQSASRARYTPATRTPERPTRIPRQ